MKIRLFIFLNIGICGVSDNFQISDDAANIDREDQTHNEDRESLGHSQRVGSFNIYILELGKLRLFRSEERKSYENST